MRHSMWKNSALYMKACWNIHRSSYHMQTASSLTSPRAVTALQRDLTTRLTISFSPVAAYPWRRSSPPVPAMKAKFMTGGSVVPVLVDPKKDSRVAIDWDGEFQVGTVAEMAGANPLIAAALKGAGVDVEKISQMQRAAAAAGRSPGRRPAPPTGCCWS